MSTLAKAPSVSQSPAPAGRRTGAVLVVLALVLLGVGTNAWAYWSTTGTGTGSATNATIDDPSAPTAVAGTGKVTLTWSPVTLSSGAAVDGYRVYRHDGSSSPEACTAVTPAHSCDDTNPVGATVQYGVVAYKGSWTSSESPLTPFTYDAVAPTTTMSVSPIANDAGYSNTDIVVTLLATDAGSGVDKIVYTLDGITTTQTNSGADTPFQTQFTLSTEGQHTLTFHAVDKAGNSESDSTTSTFKIDKTRPAAPTNLAISSDTGTSSSDRVTKTVTQTISGTAEANSKVALFKGNAPVGTTTADGAGAWSIPNVTLSDGSNNLTATATDPADNTSIASEALTATLDTEAPVAPAVTQSISSDTGSSTSDRLTKTSSQTLKGTAEANAIVTVTRTPAGSFTSTADGTGAWSVNVSLNEGSNTFAVTQTDVAGNVSSSAAAVAAIVLDTIAPTASTTPQGSTSLWRTSQSVVINALDGGTTPGVASITWSVDGGASTTVNGASTTATVPDGNLRSLTYFATDKAGNVSGGATEQYKIDSVAPSTSAALSGTAGSNGWYKSDVQVTLSVGADTSGVASREYSLTGGAPWTTYTAPFTLSSNGSYTVTFRSTDTAGNVESSKAEVFKIDKDAPTTTGSLTGNQLTLSASDSGPSGVSSIVYRVGNGPYQVYSAPVTVSGGQTISYHAIDLAGNVESPDGSIAIEGTGPSISPSAPVEGGTYGTKTANSSWTTVCTSGRVCANVTDASGIASVSYLLKGTAGTQNGKCWSGSAFVPGSSCSATASLTTGSLFAGSSIQRQDMGVGTYTLQWFATDVFGNQRSSGTITFTTVNQ